MAFKKPKTKASKEVRLPARDGKTPSNYVQKSNGEVWYQPLPKKSK